MSDSEQLVENEIDLDTFAEDFFQTKKVVAEEPKLDDEPSDVEDEEIDDDTVADVDDEDDADTEDSTEAPDGDDEDEPEAKPKNRKTAQERIKELVQKAKEAERREQDTARRLADLEAKLAPPKEEVKKVEPSAAGAPDPNEEVNGEAKYPLGEFDPNYIRDLTRFTIKQEQDAADAYRKERDKEAAASALREQAKDAWVGKLEEAEKELPDVREKINSLEGMFVGLDAGYGQYLVDVVMSLDNGPRILHHLATNPKEAKQIVTAGPAGATLALGRLDARLTKLPKVDAPKKVSKAPEPPVKTPRGSGGKFAVAGDSDDLDAFEKIMFPRKR